jgi:hypothetical protein
MQKLWLYQTKSSNNSNAAAMCPPDMPVLLKRKNTNENKSSLNKVIIPYADDATVSNDYVRNFVQAWLLSNPQYLDSDVVKVDSVRDAAWQFFYTSKQDERIYFFDFARAIQDAS